jgi:hypothetical protein
VKAQEAQAQLGVGHLSLGLSQVFVSETFRLRVPCLLVLLRLGQQRLATEETALALPAVTQSLGLQVLPPSADQPLQAQPLLPMLHLSDHRVRRLGTPARSGFRLGPQAEPAELQLDQLQRQPQHQQWQIRRPLFYACQPRYRQPYGGRQPLF